MEDRVAAPDAPDFSRFMGFRVVDAGKGTARLTMELREEFRNPGRVAHGGVLASFLDTALAAAVITTLRKDERCATIQLDLHFLRPAIDGPLVASTRVTRRTRRFAFVAGEVTDTRGAPLLRGQGIWFVGDHLAGTKPRAAGP